MIAGTFTLQKGRTTVPAFTRFPAATRACNLLGSFKPQPNAGAEKKLTTRLSRAFLAMEYAYAANRALLAVDFSFCKDALSHYAKFSAKEIELFTIGMGKFQHEAKFSETMSLFISALVNESPDRRFTVHASHLETQLDYFGAYMKKGKTVTVNGDLGNKAGCLMEGGKLIINGNVGKGLGDGTVSGRIVLYGKCEDLREWLENRRYITINSTPNHSYKPL